MLLEVTTSVESVFSRALRSIQEVSTLPTLRTPRETCLPPDLQTSLLLERERNKSSLYLQAKVSRSPHCRRETKSINITIVVVTAFFKQACSET